MVSEQPISNKPTIPISTMSSSSSENPTLTLNTQPSSALNKSLIALNITAQINKKLTPSTFPQWRAQFEALLIGYDLLNCVEGTFLCPSSTGTTADELRKTHWLKEELTLIQRGNRSITDYLHAVKALADEIAIIDHSISDDDLTLYVLMIAGPIRARESSLTFEELHDLLVGHEAYLRRLETATQHLVASAKYTKTKQYTQGGSNQWSSKPNGPNSHRWSQGPSPC
ncbi:Retrovirus-related Pol polyprotein from transposon RE1 [Fagus crenata]